MNDSSRIFNRGVCLLLALAVLVPVLPGTSFASQQSDETTPLRFARHPGSAADVPANLSALENTITRGEYENAILGLQQYLKEHPDSSRARYDLGYAYFRVHKVGDSIRELSKSLQLNINDAQAHKILGLDCISVGRYDLAEVELQQAVRLEPDSAEIHYFLGRLYYTRTVYPLALKQFQAAIRLDPSYMKAYYNLGLVMEILGKNNEAVENYLTAARLNKEQALNSAWPDEYLSAYYNRQEKPDLAIDYARKAIAIEPKCDLAYFQMAKAYQYQKKWQECEQAARKAIAINSHTPDYYYVLSQSLRRLGRIGDSRTALLKFEQLHQTAETESERWQKAKKQADREARASQGNER